MVRLRDTPTASYRTETSSFPAPALSDPVSRSGKRQLISERSVHHGFTNYRPGRGRAQTAVPGGRNRRSPATRKVSQQRGNPRRDEQTAGSRGERLSDSVSEVCGQLPERLRRLWTLSLHVRPRPEGQAD